MELELVLRVTYRLKEKGKMLDLRKLRWLVVHSAAVGRSVLLVTVFRQRSLSRHLKRVFDRLLRRLLTLSPSLALSLTLPHLSSSLSPSLWRPI